MEESEALAAISFGPLQGAADRILTRHYGRAVSIERSILLTELERRNRIWRCHLQAAESHIPETVIIKQVRSEGYAPSDLTSWDTSRFFRDWAGAQFLSAFAREEGHGPAFFGGDIALGFIVLEDMGEHTSLVEPLLNGDAASASHALLAFARRLGRMHASSMGKEEVYREIQRAISPEWAAAEARSSEDAVEERAKRVTGFADGCARLGVAAGEEAMQELAGALARLAEPGPFKAFLHGDPCPDNIFYHAPELRLIDFEFSSFGHALLDGLYGRLPFPTCWCANAVPPDVLQPMETAYRMELSAACPEALDEARFAEEASAVTAVWVLNNLVPGLDRALEQEGQWGIAGTRARILSRIEVFLNTARGANLMPALAELCRRILVELQSRWPDATALPVYPAFRENS